MLVRDGVEGRDADQWHAKRYRESLSEAGPDPQAGERPWPGGDDHDADVGHLDAGPRTQPGGGREHLRRLAAAGEPRLLADHGQATAERHTAHPAGRIQRQHERVVASEGSVAGAGA
jgi:hypothetical protein